MNRTVRGLMVLSAVASLSAVAADKVTPKVDKQSATVRCEGINECKGKGECGGANYGCAGNNECKGKGWITVTAKECIQKKGKIVGAATK